MHIYNVPLANSDNGGFCSTEELALKIASSPDQVGVVEVWESVEDLPAEIRAIVDQKEKAAREAKIGDFQKFLNNLPDGERDAALKQLNAPPVSGGFNDFEDDIPF